MSTESEKITIAQLSAELEDTQQEVKQLTMELQEAKAKLHQLVYRDGLSGLYNRRYLQDMIRKELDRSLRYASPFSLIVLDLDALDDLQQKYGRSNTELVLMNIARILEGEVRPCDLVARFSEDQFAVFLPETDLTGVKNFADRLRDSVGDVATLIEGEEVKTTITIGGATYTPEAPEVTIGDFVMTAERALKNAKLDGSNQTRIMLISVREDD